MTVEERNEKRDDLMMLFEVVLDDLIQNTLERAREDGAEIEADVRVEMRVLLGWKKVRLPRLDRDAVETTLEQSERMRAARLREEREEERRPAVVASLGAARRQQW